MDEHLITEIDWNAQLVDQLDWHWQHQLRPRLDELTDEEYFWQPVADCWSVCRRAEATTPLAMGAGEFVMDYAMPSNGPEPVTTIAWRIAHITVGCFAARVASHFGGLAVDWAAWEYAGTAAGALRQLDEQHAAWIKGVRSLGADGLGWQVGPAEGNDGEYAECPMAQLVLHINREVIHHGAEIALLRDLYHWKGDRDGL
jgi:DinB superfamily